MAKVNPNLVYEVVSLMRQPCPRKNNIGASGIEGASKSLDSVHVELELRASGSFAKRRVQSAYLSS